MTDKPKPPAGAAPRALPPPTAPVGAAVDARPAETSAPRNPLGQLLDRSVAADGPPTGDSGPGVAVALEWDGSDDSAPVITASGRGATAEAILAKAFESGVKVRRDADLVQILSVIEIGHEIPPESFVAVAEILSYVYNLNASLDPRGPTGTSAEAASATVREGSVS